MIGYRELRKQNVDRTIGQIEVAHQLEIPTMRVNTGRWGTSANFDVLMENRGIEPPLEGYTDEDGFPWVIDSLAECAEAAGKCGVVLGLENHWGLGLTPEGLLRIVNTIDSPQAHRDSDVKRPRNGASRLTGRRLGHRIGRVAWETGSG